MLLGLTEKKVVDQKRIKLREKWRRRYQRKREKFLLRSKNRLKEIPLTWIGIIPLKTNCQVCGKEIFYNQRNRSEAIHFDHRNGGHEPIKCTPKTFLNGYKCNEKNLAIWNKCNFGMLCQACNFSLRTIDRKSFLKGAVKYVFGKDLDESYL